MGDFRRAVEPSLRRKTNQAVTELATLKQTSLAAQGVLDKSEAVVENESVRLEGALAALEAARDVLSSAQEEIDADYLPEGAQPRHRIERRDQLLLTCQQLEAAYEAQKQATNAAHVAQQKAEREFAQIDKQLNRFAESLEDVLLAKQTIEELDKQKQVRLKKMEDAVRRRKERTAAEQRDAKAAQERELKEYQARQATVAKKQVAQTKDRLAQSMGLTKDTTSAIKQTLEEVHADRTEAVLELKTNTDASRAVVATQAQKFVAKQEKKRRELEESKERLLQEGKNPYVEFRRKELEDEANAKEALLRESVERKKSELAERLAREEQQRVKRDKEDRSRALQEKEHRDSLGRHVVEERNRDYIVKHTSAHTEVLDPSGKMPRVDPSQVTDIPDFTLGLGKSARIPKSSIHRITEALREELHLDREDVGAYSRLVRGLEGTVMQQNETLRSMDNAEGFAVAGDNSTAGTSQAVNDNALPAHTLAQLEGLGNAAGRVPGAQSVYRDVQVYSDADRKELLAQTTAFEGTEGASGRGELKTITAKYATKELSKFELDALQRTMDRQRDRIEEGVPQVAGGKTFEGAGFACSSPTILFKDFVPNTNYSQKFKLTNISYTYNSFKILELDDDVIDFFTLTHLPPGRMSAGMSCTLEVAFAPKLNQDIFTHIHVLTETGPLEIPLTCRIKRCAPRLAETVIDLGDMILGQNADKMLAIRNSQALPSAYEIEEVRDEGEGEQEGLVELETGAGRGRTTEEPLSAGEDANIEGEGTSETGSPRAAAFTLADLEDINEADPTQHSHAFSEELLSARVQHVQTRVFRLKQQEQASPFALHSPQAQVVPGYGETAVRVRCAPLREGLVVRKYLVRFLDVDESLQTRDSQGLVPREQLVTLTVNVLPLPIYTDLTVIDLRTCLHSRVYRAKANIFNRGKVALRVEISLAHLPGAFLEAGPQTFFVQAGGRQVVNIKFAPTPGLLSALAYYSMLHERFPDAGLCLLPVELRVAGLDLPVFFAVRSCVTSSLLALNPSALDFGRVYVNQQCIQQVEVVNLSMLPQKIAFVKMKKEFSVTPFDGFSTLLPLEARTFEVALVPTSAVSYTSALQVWTSVNDKYTLPCRGEGVEAPVQLSASVLQLRNTAPGQRVRGDVFIRNISRIKQTLELCAPPVEQSWLTISPKALVLEPGQGARVEVDFCPPKDLHAVQDPAKHFPVGADHERFFTWAGAMSRMFRGSCAYGDVLWAIPAPSGTITTAAGTTSHATDEGNEEGGAGMGAETELDGVPLDEADWGVRGLWHMPILLKPHKRVFAPEQTTSDIDSVGTTHTVAATTPLFLRVETAVALPQFTAEVDELDFHQLAVYTRTLRSFRIHNHMQRPLELKARGLNALGPFTLLRPLKPIAPMQSRVVVIDCTPPAPGLFIDVLELVPAHEDDPDSDCPYGQRVEVRLKVQGLMPTIALEGLAPPPRNWSERSGIMDFGLVLCSEGFVTRRFAISNLSSFAVEASVHRLVSEGLSPAQQRALIERTSSGTAVFTIKPTKVTIPKGGRAEIEVVLRPDRARFLPFREDLKVCVGETDEVLAVGLLAQVVARQYSVLPASSADLPITNAWLRATHATEDLLATHVSDAVRGPALAALAQLQVLDPTVKPKAAAPSAPAKGAPVEEKVHIPLAPCLPVPTLVFPDPFAPGADPTSYMEPTDVGGKPPAKGASPTVAAGSRRQSKRLRITSARFPDAQVSAGIAPSTGTYEVVLGQAARDAGIWSVSPDKGALSDKDDVFVEVICTQPPPRALGGVAVGCWKTFELDVVVRGGFAHKGDSDEKTTNISLTAFVSI